MRYRWTAVQYRSISARCASPAASPSCSCAWRSTVHMVAMRLRRCASSCGDIDDSHGPPYACDTNLEGRKVRGLKCLARREATTISIGATTCELASNKPEKQGGGESGGTRSEPALWR